MSLEIPTTKKRTKAKNTSSIENPPFYTSIVHSEKYWIEQSRVNISDYIMYMTDGEKPPAKHHIRWLFEMISSIKRYEPKNIIVAPRGSAKTEILLKFMEWWIGKYPYLTNYIGCVAFDQATLRLQDIRNVVEASDRYHNVFPYVHIDPRRENSKRAFTVWSERWTNPNEVITYQQWMTLIGKYGERKDATLTCSGMTARGVIGRRFSGMVLIDDAHDENNSATDDQCVKVENFVRKTLLPCMVKRSVINVIGTRWRANDLIGRLKEDLDEKKQPVWNVMEMAAVDDQGKSYWPEQYPLKKLKRIANSMGGWNGASFQLMFMNNTDAATSEQFTIEMFRKPLPEVLPDFKEIVVSVDLAYSTQKRADFTVFTAIARDNEARYSVYVLDMRRGKWTRSSNKIEKLIRFCSHIEDTYGPVSYVLFQHVGSEPEFAGELKGKQEELQEQLGEIQWKVKTVHTAADKAIRLERSFAIKVQQGRAYFNTTMKTYHAMVSECMSFPVGHDDIVDTLTLPFQQESWHFKANKAGILYMDSQETPESSIIAI